MKISTEIISAARLVGEETAIEYCAKAGFDHWDFSMTPMAKWSNAQQCAIPTGHPLEGPAYLAFARQLKNVGQDNGITCNQSHAPFPTWQKPIRDVLKRAIECTAEAGGSICVIHPANDASARENAEFYLELLPFAKEHGVKIATENMWNWNEDKTLPISAACSDPESFNAHLDAVNDPWFIACLDIGHAEMVGMHTSAVEMIHALGPRLQALHIHDNDRRLDSHQIPFSMGVDFTTVVKALKEIGYSGEFTLECNNYLKKYDADMALHGLTELAQVAKKLAVMFEGDA